MNDKILAVLDQVDALQKTLDDAVRQAVATNDAWREAEGNEYARIVPGEYDYPSDVRQEALETALKAITRQEFGPLEIAPGPWKERARDEPNTPLRTIAQAFYSATAPTADDRILEQIKDKLRFLTRNGRRITQKDNRLTLRLSVWRESDDRWRYSYYAGEQLDALEAFVRYVATGECNSFGLLTNQLRANNGAHLRQTHYAPMPAFQAFRNGRFDLYLFSEALATHVRQQLEALNDAD